MVMLRATVVLACAASLVLAGARRARPRAPDVTMTATVIGDVKRPGQYSWGPGPISITQILLIAGGAAADSDYIQLTRGDQVLYRNASLSRIVDGAEADLYLADGDTLIVSTPRQVDAAAAAQRAAGTLFPHDRLRVTLTGLTGPNAKDVACPRIDPQGAIRLPLLPRVALLPGSVRMVEQRIMQAYRDARVEGVTDVTVEPDQIGRQVVVQSAPLQPGDSVQLHVWDLQAAGAETVVDCIVAANGSITSPQLPPVAVQGLSEAAAETLLSQTYARQNIMQNARVTVERVPGPAAGERGL